MENWVRDVGVNHICKVVSNEMESAKSTLQMKVSDVLPGYIKRWDVTSDNYGSCHKAYTHLDQDSPRSE
jgi:hypothetical protein